MHANRFAPFVLALTPTVAPAAYAQQTIISA